MRESQLEEPNALVANKFSPVFGLKSAVHCRPTSLVFVQLNIVLQHGLYSQHSLFFIKMRQVFFFSFFALRVCVLVCE